MCVCVCVRATTITHIAVDTHALASASCCFFSAHTIFVHDLMFNACQKVTIKICSEMKRNRIHTLIRIQHVRLLIAVNYECVESSENYLRQFFSIYLAQVIFLHLAKFRMFFLRCSFFFCSNIRLNFYVEK